jgi:general secretion pathway protein G
MKQKLGYLFSGVLLTLLALTPLYFKMVQRTQEAELKLTLFNLRHTIDRYTFATKLAPQKLDDLVAGGFLRALPVDPITGKNSWRVVQEDVLSAPDPKKPGIWDIRSTSEKSGLDGTPYSEW